MPAVPIIAGIASAAAGAGAFSLAAGFTLANVAAGMAIVGGISTALGAATGNKKLMKFGAIVGLGGAALGGIASLTSGASSSLSSGAASLSPTALVDTGVSGMGSLGQAGSEMVASGFSGGSTGLLGSAAPSLAPAGFGVAQSLSPLADSAAALAPPVSAPTASSPVSAGNQAANTALRQEVTMAGPGDVSGATSAFGKAKGMLSDFGQYLGKNPEMTKIGLGALDGMSKAKAAEAAAAEEQRLIEANRARYNTSITSQRARF